MHGLVYKNTNKNIDSKKEYCVENIIDFNLLHSF